MYFLKQSLFYHDMYNNIMCAACKGEVRRESGNFRPGIHMIKARKPAMRCASPFQGEASENPLRDSPDKAKNPALRLGSLMILAITYFPTQFPE